MLTLKYGELTNFRPLNVSVRQNQNRNDFVLSLFNLFLVSGPKKGKKQCAIFTLSVAALQSHQRTRSSNN